ncbi:uncharacterized protein G2W53_002178 [Senna tora]|uniref:Uncharacterized protein n=1 Tax=Senna tora TaxID=362788 RepID=A0A834XH44_9FABA|nr:uncharacterized protein G2W53_002178 [Senna tora]
MGAEESEKQALSFLQAMYFGCANVNNTT